MMGAGGEAWLATPRLPPASPDTRTSPYCGDQLGWDRGSPAPGCVRTHTCGGDLAPLFLSLSLTGGKVVYFSTPSPAGKAALWLCLPGRAPYTRDEGGVPSAQPEPRCAICSRAPWSSPGHPRGEEEHSREVGVWCNMQEPREQELSCRWAFSSLPWVPPL